VSGPPLAGKVVAVTGATSALPRVPPLRARRSRRVGTQVSPPPRVGHPRTTFTNREAETMGLKDEVTGKAKEAEGKLTDDKSRETEGQLDQAKGNAKDAVDDLKDAAKS
jgi:uncharacterized protein YjbJ (UPF0337 family)